MEITRVWAMPNKQTFHIKPVNDLITDLFVQYGALKKIVVCDPFVGKSPFADSCMYTNDIDPSVNAAHHEDAIDFLQSIPSDSVDLMLFDPPYSPRQVSECYKKLGKSVNMQTTQASYWSNMKKEISRIVRKNGACLTCGWNSGGIGKQYGFEIEHILMVPHGGWHNDTICTVEVKQ